MLVNPVARVSWLCYKVYFNKMEAWDDAVVISLASRHCGPGLNTAVDAVCGLSLLLVLLPAPRAFHLVFLFFLLPQKLAFQIPIQSNVCP